MTTQKQAPDSKPTNKPASKKQEDKKARLAEALRANLRRRKDQSKKDR